MHTYEQKLIKLASNLISMAKVRGGCCCLLASLSLRLDYSHIKMWIRAMRGNSFLPPTFTVKITSEAREVKFLHMFTYTFVHLIFTLT